MDQASNSSDGFTLLEVIVAAGILVVTVVALLGLHGTMIRSTRAVSDPERAAQLADSISVELVRLRDLRVQDGTRGGLEALAGMIPPAESASSLRLVGSRDGLRVVRESDADDPAAGIARGERFYLVEARQQPAPLNYASGAGFLAVTLTLRWPYFVPAGPNAASAVAADPSQAAVLVLNDALTP